MMSTKKYRIRLTTDEQQELNALVSCGRAAAYKLSIARVYRPVVARVIEPPCGPVDGLLSPLGLRVNHLLSVEQGPVG